MLTPAQQIQSYVDRARRSPIIASDSLELDALERAIRAEDLDASRWGALSAPVAPLTWEHRALLLGTSAQTERIPFPVPGRCEIVGAFASVEQVGTVGVVPTLTSVDVLVDVNSQAWQTRSEGQQTAVSVNRGDQFVTLAAIHVAAPRLLGLVIDGENPVVGVTFRWKRGPGVYTDAMIALAFFVRRLPARL